MGKYFGTDGFRGEANATLTGDHAWRIGRFLAWYYGGGRDGASGAAHKVRVVIGKDPAAPATCLSMRWSQG